MFNSEKHSVVSEARKAQVACEETPQMKRMNFQTQYEGWYGYLNHTWPDTGFKGTVVNWKYYSTNVINLKLRLQSLDVKII